jgi:hypothetical protein
VPGDRVLWCANCGRPRPADELLAFWRVGSSDPRDVRFVCRPLDPRPPFVTCFREVVGPAAIHAIALAAELRQASAA